MSYYLVTASAVLGYIYRDYLRDFYRRYIGEEQPIIVSIDGNIGSGKSTFIKILKQRLSSEQVGFAAEPVDVWTSVSDKDGNNILQCFYEDKNRWSYTFQNFAYITRLMELDQIRKRPSSRKIIITERSVLTDRHVFAKMLHESGCMNELEMKIYRHWYDYFNIDVAHTIYIKTDVVNCVSRIKQRGREAERNISEEYLTSLETEHDNWLLNDDRCIILDGNVDFVNDSQAQDNIVDEFISSLQQASNVELTNLTV